LGLAPVSEGGLNTSVMVVGRDWLGAVVVSPDSFASSDELLVLSSELGLLELTVLVLVVASAASVTVVVGGVGGVVGVCCAGACCCCCCCGGGDVVTLALATTEEYCCISITAASSRTWMFLRHLILASTLFLSLPSSSLSSASDSPLKFGGG